MAAYAECSLVVIVLIKVACGFTEFSNDSKTMMMLISKIGDLERKVTKMEKNERQMTDSIRALIQTNAQLRLSNSEHEKIEHTVETRLRELEKKLNDKDSVMEELANILEFRGKDHVDVCVKSGIPACRDETNEAKGSEERSKVYN